MSNFITFALGAVITFVYISDVLKQKGEVNLAVGSYKVQCHKSVANINRSVEDTFISGE